MTLTLNEN